MGKRGDDPKLKSVSNDPLVLIVGKARKAIPEGVYHAKIASIDLKPAFKGKLTYCFDFEVVEGPHRGTTCTAFANGTYARFSSSTKLYQWYSLVTGDLLDEGAELDLKLMFNKVLEVRVEPKASRMSGIPFSNVTEIVKVIYEL